MSVTNRHIVVWGGASGGTAKARTAADRVRVLRRRTEAASLSKRYSEVTALAARLVEECRRLRSANDDLRGSAEIWIALYERQLERANKLEQLSSTAQC